MPRYLDTSALIALAAKRDRNHKRSVSYLKRSLASGERFVLGRPVLIEYLDGMTKRVGKPEAIAQLRFLEGSAFLRTEPDRDEDHGRAREIFNLYDDHAIDMTDSLSFAIMERLGLRTVFTFDKDFEIHGFERLPR